MTKLSESASGWLAYFVGHPHVRIASTSLMALKVSRRESRRIIQELLNKRAIERITYAGGGSRYMISESTTVVRSEGTRVVRSGYSYIDHSASTAIVPIAVQLEMINKATNKFLDEVKEGSESMGYEFFSSASGPDDDLLRERAKHEAAKKAAYVTMREKKAEQRKDAHRSNMDPMAWTCKDIAYEFADRLRDMWDIPPFSVTQTRFIHALSTFRKQHDTNGAIELALVDLFFDSIRQDRYSDGNHVWRAFLYKAPALLQTARERVISIEQRETDIIRDTELTNRKLSLFDEDDDV